jgi:hypothetical protein
MAECEGKPDKEVGTSGLRHDVYQTHLSLRWGNVQQRENEVSVLLKRLLRLMRNRHEPGTIGRDADLLPPIAGRERALRQAAVVRNALSGLGTGALGQVRTMVSLDRGEVRELLLTRRFIETNPGAAISACHSGHRCGAAITVVHGAAALHLDLIADGIGAALRHRPPRRLTAVQIV